MQRYFLERSVPTEIGQQFVIDGTIFHHWIHVMRAELKQQAEFVLPNQQVLIGQLISKTTNDATVEVVQSKQQQVELPIGVTIACGLSKGDKPEQIVQRGTELGANKFIFFDSEYAVAKWTPSKQSRKLQRLAKIAHGAAEQSHRTMIPTVSYCESLNELLQVPFDMGIVAWEESAKKNEHAQLPKTLAKIKFGQQLLAVFGPEGGLSEQEVAQLQTANILPAGLGPRIMRAETAPQYLLAAVSFSKELL